MRWKRYKSPEHRAKISSRIKKRIVSVVSAKYNESIPVFIAGMQRSGTTLMMNVFHLSPHIEVHDEARSSRLYEDYRIKSLDTVERQVANSAFPFVAMKAICDSHLMLELIERFPRAKVIWPYRDTADNADSQLKKFAHATEAIRGVAAKRPGGGWFAEGLSDKARRKIELVGTLGLSEFDFVCLNWWARNQLFIEQGLQTHENVRLLAYESLAAEPVETLMSVFNWLSIPWDQRYARFVHSRSVGKKSLPQLNSEVDELCTELRLKLETFSHI